jgi:hypothetical protein
MNARQHPDYDIVQAALGYPGRPEPPTPRTQLHHDVHFALLRYGDLFGLQPVGDGDEFVYMINRHLAPDMDVSLITPVDYMPWSSRNRTKGLIAGAAYVNISYDDYTPSIHRANISSAQRRAFRAHYRAVRGAFAANGYALPQRLDERSREPWAMRHVSLGSKQELESLLATIALLS